MSILTVRNLKITISPGEQTLVPVKNISFSIAKGKVLALVGESGAGKSITSMAVPGLLPFPDFRVESGEILLQGKDLLSMSRDELMQVRRRDIGVVFQEPMTSLNPVLTIGYQLTEAIPDDISKEEKAIAAIDMLRQLGINDAENCFKSYPHQFSGGMRQRVMIAVALLKKPQLLIADEPTTALDVTVQKDIMIILKEMIRKNRNMSLLFVTHDLGLVREIADEVCVMYAGYIQESALKDDFFREACHPYAKALLNARPEDAAKDKPLPVIKGRVPDLTDNIKGCYFHPRCSSAYDLCRQELPVPEVITGKRYVRCHLFAKEIC